jgi:hypothetical protein
MREKNHQIAGGLILCLLAVAGNVSAAEKVPAPSTRPTLILLPLQDRTGNPAMAELVEKGIRDELSMGFSLPDATEVRDVLRRSRIRETRALRPQVLNQLARDFGGEMFFSVTLYRADLDPLPQVGLAGRVVAAGRPEIVWTGFQARSGIDDVGMLGRGRRDDLALLAGSASRDLVDDFLGLPADPPSGPLEVQDLFLRDGFSADDLGTVAVIPFDVLTDAIGPDEIFTDLALAVLHRRGFRLATPGMVREILLQRGVLHRGEIDHLTRAALRGAVDVGVFFTGTVESYENTELQLNIRIGLSGRLVEAETGRILWMGALEQATRESDTIFPRVRSGSPEHLAERMLHSLVSSFADREPLDTGEQE